MFADDLDVVDFTVIFARLAEADAAKAENARRAAALGRRNKTMAAASKTAQTVAASDAPAPVKSAKLATQNAKKREADAVYRAAVTEEEADTEFRAMITEVAQRVGLTIVIPPRPGEVQSFDSAGRLVVHSVRVGNRISHYDAGGKMVFTTTISGRKLFSRAADGKIIGKHVIKN